MPLLPTAFSTTCWLDGAYTEKTIDVSTLNDDLFEATKPLPSPLSIRMDFFLTANATTVCHKHGR